MQAIQTKYIPVTNTRPSRIKASCAAGSVTVSYDHALNIEGNHKAACDALCAKLEWNTEYYTSMVGGTLLDGSMVWVFVPRELEQCKRAVFETRYAMMKGQNNGNPHTRDYGQAVDKITDDEYSPLRDEYRAFCAAKENLK